MVEIFILGSSEPFRCELGEEKITELCDKLSHGAGTVMYDWAGRGYLLRVAHITAVTFNGSVGTGT
jgi:hypothetical protein